MNSNGLITLLSDFGWQDAYVGVMKGVITQINPQANLIDITHQIPPQNLLAGRFALLNAYPYFPAGTVHLGVVDPGVGSNRRGVAIELAEGFLVGPDNGLFSGILNTYPVKAAVELTNPEYWLSGSPSNTFHGRDIFAPVAAHLANGVALEKLGKALDLSNLTELSLPPHQVTDRGVAGYIQYVDHFGNLITNIPANVVAGNDSTPLTVKKWSLLLEKPISASQAYSDRPPGEVVVLVGSHGWVEIAVNSGSAREQLQLNWNDAVELGFEN